MDARADAPPGGLAAAGLFDDPDRALVRLTGADRTKYAQAMLTNDVKALAPGEGCLACALVAKGKMVALARVMVEAEAIVLDTDAERAAVLRDHLKKFVVINKVVVEAGPPVVEVALEGPRAPEALERALGGSSAGSVASLAPFAFRDAVLGGAPARVVRFSTTGPVGFRVLARPEDAGGVREALGAAVAAVGGGPCSTAEVERARVLRGWPVWGREIDEATLPPQAGLTEATISYTKGCYLGQEPIAMLKFRGQLNRRLCRLTLHGPPTLQAADGSEPAPAPAPAPRTPLFATDGRALEHSQLTSVAPALAGAPDVALALVQRDAFEPGTRLRLGSPDGPEAVVDALSPLAWA